MAFRVEGRRDIPEEPRQTEACVAGGALKKTIILAVSIFASIASFGVLPPLFALAFSAVVLLGTIGYAFPNTSATHVYAVNSEFPPPPIYVVPSAPSWYTRMPIISSFYRSAPPVNRRVCCLHSSVGTGEPSFQQRRSMPVVNPHAHALTYRDGSFPVGSPLNRVARNTAGFPLVDSSAGHSPVGTGISRY